MHLTFLSCTWQLENMSLYHGKCTLFTYTRIFRFTFHANV
jgi:hypothetical protein